jgi:hypothetical protein
MLSALAEPIDRRRARLLAIVLAIRAVAPPLGIHVRDHLKPHRFDVASSGSAKAREGVAEASGTDRAPRNPRARRHVQSQPDASPARRRSGTVRTPADPQGPSRLWLLSTN